MSRRNRGRERRTRTKSINNKLLNTIIISLLIVIIALIGILYGIKALKKKKIANEKERINNQQQEIFKSTDIELEELESLDNYKTDSLIRISAVGDILCGEKLEQYGKPYNSIFSDIRKYLKDNDLAIGTYETDVYDFKEEFASSVKNAGINYVSLAHNHALDYGIDGLHDNNKYLKEIGMETVGTYEETSEKRVRIFEKKGVKIAIMAYTYDDHREGVNIYDEEMVKSDLEYAEKNANFSIVMMHWGNVNTNEVSTEQEKQADFLINNGADIILGAHPSAVQKMEVVKNDEEKDCFVAYSLGDFTSDFENENANLELILNLQVFVDKEGNAQIYKVDYTPVYMIDYGKDLEENRFKILDMKSEIANYDTEDSNITEDIYDKLVRAVDRLNSIIIK